MIDDESKVTTFSTICVILLREVRMERGIHQAQIADWIGKTPSAWTKVEAGKSPLSFETFLRVCGTMQVNASTVMATAERYAAMLGNRWGQKGWTVLYSEIDLNEDALMHAAQEYWSSPGFRNQQLTRLNFQSVLNGPIYNADGTTMIAPVFLFALDAAFRESQLSVTPSAPMNAMPNINFFL